MIKEYKQRIIDKKLNTYFICEADKDYNIKKAVIVPSNPTCNCYSVAKSFTAMAIGLLYDKKLLTPQTKLVDVLKDYLPKGKVDDISEALLLSFYGFKKYYEN